jgi:DNA-binding response OmpR family regulator
MTQRITFVTNASVDERLVEVLREHEFDVWMETKPSVADGRLLASPPDLLIFDILDASAAIELLQKVRSSHRLKSTPVIVIAEWGTGQATLALSQGADAFERKPIDASRLLTAVENLLRPKMVMTAKVSGLNRNEE